MSGCYTTKQTTDTLQTWIGNSKQNLIMQWGPPTSTSSDGAGGDVLMYATRVYRQLPNGSTLDSWHYRIMYANADGRLYHWIYRSSPNPPERVDVRFLSR